MHMGERGEWVSMGERTTTHRSSFFSSGAGGPLGAVASRQTDGATGAGGPSLSLGAL